ncbi:MAG: hemolysin family protein [Smithellaceae bacterium]
MDPSLQLSIIFILFLLSGFFSSAEASLFSLTDLHLHKMKLDRYPFLSFVGELLGNRRRLLITIVVGNEAVNISISILAAAFFINLFGANGQWMAIIFTSVVLLVAGESVPKTFGVTYPMQLSSATSPVLIAFSCLEYPFVAGLEKLSDFILSRYRRGKSPNADAMTEDEFKTLIDAGSRQGVVEESQKELINRIFELGDKPVTDIMVPRVDMFCLPLTMTVEAVIAEIVRARHERVPFYAGDREDITGILYARDLLNAALQEKKPDSIEKLLKRPYFVPEGKTINGLLHDFRESHMQIAIVVDEYGGVSGLVTLEDILEHLFEEDLTGCNDLQSGCERVDANTIIVPGRLPLEQFNILMQAQLPEDEFDTIGGFILHLFGKLPSPGEEYNYAGFIFRIENVGRARILKIRVEHAPEQNKDI